MLFLRVCLLPYEKYSDKNELSHSEMELLKSAIFFSSSDFYQEIKNINLNDPNLLQKVNKTLLKYTARAKYRPTPFGLFSTISSGEFKDNNPFQFSNKITISNFFDYQLLNHFRSKNKILFNSKQEYRLNNSIYLVENTYRYIEKLNKDSRSVFVFSSIIGTNLFDEIYRRYKGRGFAGNEILKFLESLEYSRYVSTNYLESLISNQILQETNFPTLSHKRFQLDILSKMENKEICFQPNSDFESINISELINVENIIKSNFNYNKSIWRINSYRNSEKVNVPGHLKGDILRISKLLFLTKPKNQKSQYKKLFLHEFKNKFQEGIFYPLMKVFDNEVGIKVLLDENTVDRNNKITGFTSKLKFELLNRALANNSQIVQLFDEDLKALENDKKEFQFPNFLTFSGYTYIDPATNQLILVNPFFQCKLFGLIGRFTSDDILEVSQFLELKEEIITNYPNLIFAELTYSRSDIISNICSKEKIFDFEIPIYYDEDRENGKSILLEDIYIQVNEDQVVLFSKSNSKVIIPISLNSFYHDLDNLSVFQFLSEYQFFDTCDNLSWDWEFLINSPFLPRVEYKNNIICESIWNLECNNINYKRNHSFKNFKESFDNFVKLHSVPDKIILCHHETFIRLDLKNILSIHIVKNLIDKLGKVILKESLLDNLYESPLVDNKQNKYNFEIQYSFLATNKINFKNLKIKNYDFLNYSKVFQGDLKEAYFPFENWIYYKFYLHESKSDALLIKISEIINSISNLTNKEIVWFFIRYTDPYFHLRIRIYIGNDSSIAEKIWMGFGKGLYFNSDFKIYDIKIETYKRELSRYRYNNIEFCELIFSINSNLVIEVIKFINENRKFETRLLFYSLILVKMVFDQFMEIEIIKKGLFETIEFLKSTNNIKSNSFNEEINLNLKRLKEISNYDYNLNEHGLNKIQKLFNNYLSELIEIEISTKIKFNDVDLILSLNHMFVNRIFNSSQLSMEFVIYSILYKYYSSPNHLK